MQEVTGRNCCSLLQAKYIEEKNEKKTFTVFCMTLGIKVGKGDRNGRDTAQKEDDR